MVSLRPDGEAIERVEALLVRPPVVVDQRLPKMKGIVDRFPRDVHVAGIDVVQSRGRVGLPRIDSKFVREREKDVPGFLIAGGIFQLGVSFPQNLQTCRASPGPHPQVSGVGIAHRVQPFESRVDPAVEGHVHRPVVTGLRRLKTGKDRVKVGGQSRRGTRLLAQQRWRHKAGNQSKSNQHT